MTVLSRSTMPLLICILLGISLSFCYGFWIPPNRRDATDCRYRARVLRRHSSPKNSDDNAYRTLEARLEEQRRFAVIDRLLQTDLTTVQLVGQAVLPSVNTTQSCLCLTTTSSTNAATAASLLIPVTAPQLKLLEFATHRQPVSKSVLLSLNLLLVNRDGSLFDNLPYATWSKDPLWRNRDAAHNVIESKFHLGKRDVYNRLLGKDWQGKSLAIGNVALRLKYALLLESDDDNQEEEDSQTVLARRILQVQMRDWEMQVAEMDSEIAVARQGSENNNTSLDPLEAERTRRVAQRNECRQQLTELDTFSKNKADSPMLPSWLTRLLQNVADWTTDHGKNAAPYRGAMGYAPQLDTQSDIDGSHYSYTCPFDLMKEILEDQLNAIVIGVVLENASLLQTSIGGLVVLRRTTPTKTLHVAGEDLKFQDPDEDYGNPGIQGGETVLVECDADEAIGMALSCQVPIQVETEIWNRASVMTERLSVKDDETASSVRRALPLWTTIDPELTVLREGQASNLSSTERVAPIRVPRTTTSLFDSLWEPRTGNAPKNMFPTDNPIKTLGQYDTLSNDDKARTLLSLSNFQGRLPRPRVLRQAEKRGSNPLDEMLLPLIDESVRRQYLIRGAERRGDVDLATRLKSSKSRHQIAQEKAQQARDVGEDEVAKWWDNEATFYESLRADVTQDEGSYSRFLDRDDWYERERQQMAKKLDKKKFGNLLDGVE